MNKFEQELNSDEVKRIWYLDYIRGRIGHEFMMEEITDRGSLVWLCDDPRVLENDYEYHKTVLAAYFVITTLYGDGLVELVERTGKGMCWRITDAGIKCCAEVMEASGLSGANDS